MRSASYDISDADLRNLLRGEGGLDLERVPPASMRIVGVQPGTTAARLDARNGDLIDSINDIPLVSVPEAYRAGSAAIRAPAIVIKGTRDGEPYITTLTLRR
jgi:hypothetical protein